MTDREYIDHLSQDRNTSYLIINYHDARSISVVGDF